MYDQITYYGILLQPRSPQRNPRTTTGGRELRKTRRARRARRPVQ